MGEWGEWLACFLDLPEERLAPCLDTPPAPRQALGPFGRLWALSLSKRLEPAETAPSPGGSPVSWTCHQPLDKLWALSLPKRHLPR